MKVVIIGAGIGGAALALSLEQLGVEYVLLEQAHKFQEVGAGIQLSPNGVQILERLGLKDDLAGFCTIPDLHKYSVWDTGETILSTPLMPKVVDTYGFAYYHAHRADLIEALTRRLNPKCLHLNTQVIAVEQDESSVWAECADGSRFAGDVLIGADGIHSFVRQQFFAPEAPRASGYVTWRGVVDSDDIAHLKIPVSAYVDMGPRLSFVYYFVSGGKRLNWLALGKTNDEKRESWSQVASKSEVMASFEGWYDRPRQIIEATEHTFVTALYDRTPLDCWVSERVALMGDAAHAMLPYHAQGAVQSIEDAWVLARTLHLNKKQAEQQEKSIDIAHALQRYQDLRLDRANLLVQQSRNAERWYHLDSPQEVEARNARFRNNNKTLDGGFSPQQHWLYSYDAEKAALGTDHEWRGLSGWS